MQDGPQADPQADEPRNEEAVTVVSFEARQVEARLRRLVAGDAEAAAWLYDTFAPLLYRRLRARYGYPGGLDADDLLQDSFVYFFQGQGEALQRILARVPAGELTQAALERRLWDMACGVAANRRRSAALRRRTTTSAEDATLAEAPLAERLAVSRELLQRLDNCLRASRAKVYLYFKLRYADGLSPSEIAAETGWSAQTTYKLKDALNAALEKCAERLGLKAP